LTVASGADTPKLTAQQTQFFENKIRPLLSAECYQCHSHQAERVKGGLYLDSREGVLKGGKTGPAIVPGHPEKSLLIRAVSYKDPDLEMPPKGDMLTDQQIADLTAWVKMGAPDPRMASATPTNWNASAKSHWAWQPVRSPAVPAVKKAGWCQTPVDNFILAKLQEKGLTPSPAADKRTLIRRATFDLIGLPPTPEEVNDFLADKSPNAFEKVVDRLLASPHYGETWGRHWLDVARYSDTKGQVRRQREDPNSPFAWTYRDYVIRSFNDDKPFNAFILEQVAADKLPGTQKNLTNLTALGFLTVGDRFMGMQNDIINDRIDVVTKGFMGLTVSCARCHDHKFDPIPQKDYYALHGIFASSIEPEDEPIIQKTSGLTNYADYYKQRTKLDKEEEEIAAKFRELARKRDRDALRELQREQRRNQSAIASLEMTHPGAPARAMVLVDSPRPRDSSVLIRGEAGNRGPVEPRHFLELIAGPNPKPFSEGSGRLQLAQAIVDPVNPLTARVLVNRVWQHHFGAGFVPTPDDFGTMSEPPSHPELLDYLAARFMAEGWSMKKLHKTIVLSAVYQQSSANNPRYAEIDPGNRLLWRANIGRLEFESIRDSILAIGGSLNTNMYGRPVDFDLHPESTRRSVYGLVDRSDIPSVMVNFDFALPDMPTGKRHETIVPQQALFFMNSPLVIEQARKLVAQPEFVAMTDREAKIRFLYQRVFQRQPTTEETQLAAEFIVDSPVTKAPATSTASGSNQELAQNKRRPFVPQGQGPPGQRGARRFGAATQPITALNGWEKYAHVLLQANELVYVH
jgi:cytochrome c553